MPNSLPLNSESHWQQKRQRRSQWNCQCISFCQNAIVSYYFPLTLSFFLLPPHPSPPIFPLAYLSATLYANLTDASSARIGKAEVSLFL